MQEQSTYSKYRNSFWGQSFPFAYVDMDLLDGNIQHILSRAGNKKIRIASKSVRCKYILKYILESDSQFQGLMCFSAMEAVWLSEQGFDDLLIAYPVWDAQEVRAICAEVRKGKQIICMVDLAAHVQQLNQIAEMEDVILPLCLDLDMSSRFPGVHFGVFRSAIHTVDAALALQQLCQDAQHVELMSLMGYEAQIAGLGDRIPGQFVKNKAVSLLKRLSQKQVARLRGEVVAALQAAGPDLRIVNGGGTGSMESTRLEAKVTEITVGSGFFASHLFDYYQQFRHLPAAGFAVQVVRKPQSGLFTCHGGGYIASGTVGREKQPLPYLPAGARLHANEGAGEVQTPVVYKGEEKLALGDPIFMRHSKAGELCERFNTLLLLRSGKVTMEVNTYRGDGKCFL
ncbi:MAG TPA: amino acid deaminase/aldolase [Bacteroidetes bacterium]|nr:amino acid deaminase/aldolase [Bacteroidota bacterium]